MPRSFLKMTALLVFTTLSLYSLVFVPLYEIIACDVMLMNSLWFDAVDLLMRWTEILGLVLMLAFLMIGVYRAGDARNSAPLYYLLGGALLFKYVAAIAALSVVHGSLDFTLDYSGYAVSLLLELLPCLAVVLLTHRYTVRDLEARSAKARAAKLLGEDTKEDASPLPFKRLFCRQSPLQGIAYLGVGMVALEHLVAFILSEIAFTMLGASFSASDLPITLLYCLLLVLLPAFLGYIVFFYTVRLVTRKCPPPTEK